MTENRRIEKERRKKDEIDEKSGGNRRKQKVRV
jgi:hypothetical protein